MVPVELPGLKAINAVDAAGVHPLLLAIGSERYVPYREREPQEILTIANALLGFGACSLAKYLLIVAGEDNPQLDIHDIADFLRHLLERVDWTRDLHFQTRTTIDTLDYSGTGLNEGSKVVIAAAGPKKRELSHRNPTQPGPAFRAEGIRESRFRESWPSKRPPFRAPSDAEAAGRLATALESVDQIRGFPLILLVDDADFTARTLNNLLWVTFTRSNPSHDVYGIGSFIENKHWGCHGPLIIDARLKPHHAPPLVEDPGVTRKVDRLGERNGPLHGII